VSLQLALDRGRREGRELEVAPGIETFHGFQQADEGNLFQIIELLAAIRESSRKVCGETLMGLDQLVPELPLAGSSILDEFRSLHLSRVGAHAVTPTRAGACS
jgi:hypothetical protein